MPGLCAAVGMNTDDQPLYRSRPPVCRLDAPKPLQLSGLVLLLIGCGCLFFLLYVGDRPEYTLQECGRAGLGRVTDEALPPPPPCGRQCGTEEGRQAAGPLPAGSALALCRSVSGGNIYQIKRPATGRWRTNKRQRVDAKQPRAAARTRPGELQRGVTGARNEPGVAVLARHLPSRDAERPFFLL
jgi:hypothetical protein